MGCGGQTGAAGRLVTAVRFRESDCRLSSEDVTYPSAGLLALNFSWPRLRGVGGGGGLKKKKEKDITQKYLMRSFLKSIRHSSCQ